MFIDQHFIAIYKKLRLEAALENESKEFDTDLDSDSDSHRSYSNENGDEIECNVQDTSTDCFQLNESKYTCMIIQPF